MFTFVELSPSVPQCSQPSKPKHPRTTAPTATPIWPLALVPPMSSITVTNNNDLKTDPWCTATFTSDFSLFLFHHCPCFLIHYHHCFHQPFFNPQLPQRPPNYLSVPYQTLSPDPLASPASAVHLSSPSLAWIQTDFHQYLLSLSTFSPKTLSNTFIPCSSIKALLLELLHWGWNKHYLVNINPPLIGVSRLGW